MIYVRVHGVTQSGETPEQIEQISSLYQSALDRFTHAIREVDVRVTDINGPRGGVDKSCRVQLRLFPRGILTAKSVGVSCEHAAREACDRLKALLTRRMSRRKEISRATVA